MWFCLEGLLAQGRPRWLAFWPSNTGTYSNVSYNPVIINASEERTAKQLVQRIESVANMESLTLNNQERKPNLLILDEVDGTLEGENKGAITNLLKYIFTGEKKKKDDKECRAL